LGITFGGSGGIEFGGGDIPIGGSGGLTATFTDTRRNSAATGSSMPRRLVDS
jgi:hypothetical protein